jgi:hypothetical protein
MYVFFFISHDRRELIHFNVTASRRRPGSGSNFWKRLHGVDNPPTSSTTETPSTDGISIGARHR